MASAVPPTPVTHGSEAGHWVCASVVFGSQFAPVAAAPGELSPQSPEDTLKPMPSTAAVFSTCSYGAMIEVSKYVAVGPCMISPQELETTSARCLSTIICQAARKSWSVQEFAPT